MRLTTTTSLALVVLLLAAGHGTAQEGGNAPTAGVESTAGVMRHDWSLELAFDALNTGDTNRLAATADQTSARIALVYAGRIRPTLTVNVVVDAVDSGSEGAGITEAFLAWDPVPVSPFKHALRVGALYPPLSLENTDPAWTSPYSDSFSAINTWVGEELRVVGGEWSVSRALGPRASQRSVRLLGAAYYGNDPAGVILVWRGFALHSRQSRLGDSLRLPAVPQIQPGMMFAKQAPATEPFVETDHAPGYYYGSEWRLGRHALLTALHYDNHADPLTLRQGHYGWTTRFDHVGAMFELPAGLGLIAQWMDGSTVMGPVMNGAHVVDNGFSAWFLLLTKQHKLQRWSLRFDDFAVSDHDTTPLDDNREAGRALTIAWRFAPEASWAIGLEWQSLDLHRPALGYFSQPAARRENQLRFDLRYRFRPGIQGT